MAAPKRPILEVERREELGSRAVRRLRRTGAVPGVVYGVGADPFAFKVDSRALRSVLHDVSAVIDVRVQGEDKALPVIVKDRQVHPVRDHLMHIDLLQVRLDEKIQTTVPLEVHGAEDAPGIKEGGVLDQPTHELNIEALPTDIPERIEVDVSGMESAATMHLSAVSAPEGVVFLDDLEETIVATVVVPTEVEEPEVEEEAELVGDEAAGAEGETGEEGEQAPEGGDGGGDSGGGE